MSNEQRLLKVFLCHSSADKPKVRELYRYLKKRRIKPWFDEVDLLGGQDWQVEIPKALLTSDAIIICLTRNSVDKEGYIQKEIKYALDKALEIPEGGVFLIPVRFEDCEVPFSLRRYQWVDLFKEAGREKVIKALKLRASQIELMHVELPKKDGTKNFSPKEGEHKSVEKIEQKQRNRLARLFQKFAKDYEMLYSISLDSQSAKLGLQFNNLIIQTRFTFDENETWYQFGAVLKKLNPSQLETVASKILLSQSVTGLTERCLDDTFVIMGARETLTRLSDKEIKNLYMEDVEKITVYYQTHQDLF